MAKGSDVQPTQKAEFTPPPQANEIMDLAMPGIRDFAATVPQRYQGSTVAPFNAEQQAAQDAALQASTRQNTLAGSGADALGGFMTDLWNPESNTNLQAAIHGATQPISDNLMHDILPAIRADFGGANYGSSRRALAEGQAVTGASRAIGDTASKLVQSTYDTNTSAVLKALGLLPTVQGAQTSGATTEGAVGDVRQAMDQALLNQNVGNYNYDMYAPFLQAKDLFSLVPGIPGGTTTATANNPPAPSMGMQMGSGALSGAAAGSMFGPWGAVAGGGLGAVLPFLMK